MTNIKVCGSGRGRIKERGIGRGLIRSIIPYFGRRM
jgi:hypothetical protein